MSNGYRDGAFAVGLIAGVGIALNLVVWLDYAKRYQPQNASDAKCDPDCSEIPAYWDGFIGTFVSPSDTLAQWIMAAFTIAATFVLILTLRSANKTNKAAIEAAKAASEANELIRNDTRPWLKISLEPKGGIQIIRGEVHAMVDFTVENIGKSPAVDVQFHWQAFRSNSFSPRQVAQNFLIGWARSKAFNSGTRVIFPGDNDGPGESLTFGTITEHENGAIHLVFGVTYRMDGVHWFGHTIEVHAITHTSKDSFSLELMTDGRLVH